MFVSRPCSDWLLSGNWCHFYPIFGADSIISIMCQYGQHSNWLNNKCTLFTLICGRSKWLSQSCSSVAVRIAQWQPFRLWSWVISVWIPQEAPISSWMDVCFSDLRNIDHLEFPVDYLEVFNSIESILDLRSAVNLNFSIFSPCVYFCSYMRKIQQKYLNKKGQILTLLPLSRPNYQKVNTFQIYC